MASNKFKSKVSVDDLAKDIVKQARALDVEPWAIKKAQYFASGKHSEWEFRKVGGFNQVLKTFFPEELDQSARVSIAELRRENNALQKLLGNQDLFLERIEQAVSKIQPAKATPYKPKKNKSTERALNLILSDLHIGSDIAKDEVGHQFGPVEEARALAYIAKNVIDYKMQYRDETELNLFVLGDVTEGELHARTSADLLHLQNCRAMYLLTQFVQQMSANFKKVTVYFAVGNHGRDMAIHKDRATALKYNAHETTIYYGVKLATKHLTNVSFVHPKTPWVEASVLGHKMYATHGDTHFNPGNVGNKIDIRGLEAQANTINASLKDQEEFKVFMCGHVHTPLAMQIKNGQFIVINGALTPPNSYATSLNIHESPQVQVMWETTKKHAVGDTRMINAAGSSKDENLDKIIKPFTGL